MFLPEADGEFQFVRQKPHSQITAIPFFAMCEESLAFSSRMRRNGKLIAGMSFRTKESGDGDDVALALAAAEIAHRDIHVDVAVLRLE